MLKHDLPGAALGGHVEAVTAEHNARYRTPHVIAPARHAMEERRTCAIWWGGLQTIGSFLVALVLIYIVFQRGFSVDWAQVWIAVRRTDQAIFAPAGIVFYGAFVVRTLRWQRLLANVGFGRAGVQRLPSLVRLGEIAYLAWFANCVTVARLGDAYRAYLLKQAAGVSFTTTLATILAERLIDLVALAALLFPALLAAFGTALPLEIVRGLLVCLLLVGVAGTALLGLQRWRGGVAHMLPERLRVHYARLADGVVDSFQQMPLLLIYSALGWVAEAAALYLAAAAVGAPISIAGAVTAALVASLLTTVPFTPAGLGVTEASLVFVLSRLGLEVNTAGAIALLTRVITYWSIVLLGSLLYLVRRPAWATAAAPSGSQAVNEGEAPLAVRTE